MRFIKVKGIVIKEVKTGEADKIVTIFSDKIGKIQAAAKGARRPQSRFIAGTQFLSFSDFILLEGKDLYSVRDCHVIEPFYNIRDDLIKITYAAHIIDLVNEVSDENLSYYNLLKLLLNTLYMISDTDKTIELISRIFEIRLMSIIGYSPQINECLNCNSKSFESIYFSPRLGGLLCENCKQFDRNSIKILSGTLDSLQYILHSSLNKIFSFNVSSNVLNELKVISEQYYKEHLNKKFNTLEFLDTLKKSNNGENQND